MPQGLLLVRLPNLVCGCILCDVENGVIIGKRRHNGGKVQEQVWSFKLRMIDFPSREYMFMFFYIYVVQIRGGYLRGLPVLWGNGTDLGVSNAPGEATTLTSP